MFAKTKSRCQGVWDNFKKSKFYNGLRAIMAFLPLIDIVTDYAFIILTLTKSDSKALEEKMAWFSLGALYMSSRLVLSMYLFHADTITITNITLYYLPFLDLYKKILDDGTDDLLEIARLITMYFLFLITVPLTHLIFVSYCVCMQIRSHVFDRRDYAAFCPLTFLEITESLPQLIMQTIIFCTFHLGSKWGTEHEIFILSSFASVMGMVKAINMYYRRYAVVKRGFAAESISEFEYILELLNLGTDDINLALIFKVLNRLKSQKCDLNETNKYGHTTLIAASRKGHHKVVELLLDFDVDHSVACKNGWTALIWASEEGQSKVVDLLLQAGAKHSVVGNNGDTALIRASGQGHEKAVHLLLQAGADHSVTNSSGDTALSLATRKGHQKVVDLLLNIGEDCFAAKKSIQNSTHS